MANEISRSIQRHVVSLGGRALFSLPDGALTRMFGEPPEVARGLRPDAWALSRLVDLVEGTVGEAAAVRIETDDLSWAASDRLVVEVDTEDFDLGEPGNPLPARLYRPAAAPEMGPLMVYFHGGGWVVGSLESHDFSLRRLADGCGARILAVDYALAPEDPFPAAPDDALRAWDAVIADPERFGADPDRIATGGDSAGANLGTVLCQDLKAAGRRQPLFQLLIYPVTDIGGEWQSYRDFETGFYLTRERMDWYEGHYVKAGDAEDPRAAPFRAADLSGLAPAYVTTALADPLRDEGEAYARRLMEASVETRLDRFPLVHAWFNQTVTKSARTAHRVLAERVRELFAATPSPPPADSPAAESAPTPGARTSADPPA